MPLVAAYFRPESLDEALSLLTEPNRIVLGGGTTINSDRQRSDIEVVDLQALGLDLIESSETELSIGATATLADVAGSDQVPDGLRALARRESPSTLRTLATIGGLIASAHRDSLLIAALLVHDASVDFAGAEAMRLAAVLAQGVPSGAIITAVRFDPSGVLYHASTGRTPADVPIVAAVARAGEGGRSLALTGVAATPISVDPDDPVRGLQPPGDFRGSGGYRIELAGVLAARALGGLR